MIPDALGKALHDKATRGLPLSADEQAQLAEWYRRLDEDEGKQLAAAAVPSDLTVLRQRVQASPADIITASQRIQALTEENEALRKETAELQKRLPGKAS